VIRHPQGSGEKRDLVTTQSRETGHGKKGRPRAAQDECRISDPNNGDDDNNDNMEESIEPGSEPDEQNEKEERNQSTRKLRSAFYASHQNPLEKTSKCIFLC
jgi:hypothetical protein